MGVWQRQREKTDQRIVAACSARLESGEAVSTSALVTSRVRYLWWAIAIFPVIFLIEYAGRGFAPLVIGGWMGAATVVSLRTYYVVLTNRRLLLLRLRRMSTRRIDSEHSYPLEAVGQSIFQEGLLNGKLTISVGGERFDFQVARPYWERGEELAQRL